MTVYVDYVFFINFLFDFILLMGINILLKRNGSFKRLILSSIYGGLTTFILYINMNSLLYFFIKIFTGILLVIFAFKYKDLKYTITNFIYLLLLSIILGGSLYFINSEIGYTNDGIMYFTSGLGLNFLILLFFFILITIIFVRFEKRYKRNINTLYEVDILLNNKILKLSGFLDTGNNLYDPYFNRPIIILNKGIELDLKKVIFVPFETLNSKGIMKCFLVDKIFIKDIGYRENVLIGLSNDKFHISGVDIILHRDLMEG